MQVTCISDNITHAVIGNQQARDFSISNSAEFFNILSNTLYSDKILAVVREILCNAWDIHIQTGITDTPVEVSLIGNKLTIRDFGTGISDDDIHPIYAIYGNSTKKLDGEQTGGFGLGSKAPFAYVDHFEVISYYAGRKTVYAVSKSSAEVGGKPSITPLLSVPCGSETGLSVSLSIQDIDVQRFRKVITVITRFGEMNVIFKFGENDETKLSTISFSQIKHGFAMVKDITDVSGAENYLVFVRYGNVVYPVPVETKIEPQLNKIHAILSKLGTNSSKYYNDANWKIIFQAKPNTISVTPSRESLSITDFTVQSLNELFESFIALTDKQLGQACIEVERELIESTWKNGRVTDLLNSKNQVPILFDSKMNHISIDPQIITNMNQMSRALMTKFYPDFSGFRKKDIQMRLETIEKAILGGPKNRGKIQSFYREYTKYGNIPAQPWFQRTLVLPLVNRLNTVPELSGSKLFVYGEHADVRMDSYSRRYNKLKGAKFVEATKLSPRRIENYLPFLRNIVVISFNRIDVTERLPDFPIFKTELGKTEEFFVYIVSRTDKKIDIARKFFTEQGMTIVDLTMRQNWEPEEILLPFPKSITPPKPRKKGLLKLSNILIPAAYGGNKLTHERLRTHNSDYGDLPRIEFPQFIVKINPRANDMPDLIYIFDSSNTLALVELYGNLGGVALNDNQYQRYTKELKIPEFEKWILAKLEDETLNNPRIQLGFQYNHDKITHLNYSNQQILSTIFNNPELAIEFGVLNEMTSDDRKLLRVIEYTQNSVRKYSFRQSSEASKIKDHIKSVKTSAEVQAVIDKIEKSNLIGLLEASALSEVFGENPSKHQKAQRSGAFDILQFALKG